MFYSAKTHAPFGVAHTQKLTLLLLVEMRNIRLGVHRASEKEKRREEKKKKEKRKEGRKGGKRQL